jgi:hypothetical protein
MPEGGQSKFGNFGGGTFGLLKLILVPTAILSLAIILANPLEFFNDLGNSLSSSSSSSPQRSNPAVGGAGSTPRDSQLVKAGIPGTPDSESGDVFFSGSYNVVFRDGYVVLAGSADGTDSFGVDDAIAVTINRPDGTRREIYHDFSSRCSSPLVNIAGLDLTNFLQVGNNVVEVALENRCPPNIGNGDIYIVADDSTLTSR